MLNRIKGNPLAIITSMCRIQALLANNMAIIIRVNAKEKSLSPDNWIIGRIVSKQ